MAYLSIFGLSNKTTTAHISFKNNNYMLLDQPSSYAWGSSSLCRLLDWGNCLIVGLEALFLRFFSGPCILLPEKKDKVREF